MGKPEAGGRESNLQFFWKRVKESTAHTKFQERRSVRDI